jgi:hypothetical protein
MAAFANDSAERPPSGFRANLQGAALADLVQLECLARSNQVFRVTSGHVVGYLFFGAGELVHAIAGDLSGEAAAYEILGWSDGTFEACRLEAPERPSISLPWQALLLQAAQAKDEGARAKLVNFPPRPRSAARPTSGTRPTMSQSPPASTAPPPPSGELASIRDLVRVDPGGNVLSGRGASDELAPVVAYTARVASLIGDGLGLGKLVAMECQSAASRLLLHVERSGNVVGLRTSSDADASAVRQRFGL